MIIYDRASKKELTEVTLILTPDEAVELADSARSLAVDPARHHDHVTSADGTRELTIAVHTADNLEQFDAETRSLLGRRDE